MAEPNSSSALTRLGIATETSDLVRRRSNRPSLGASVICGGDADSKRSRTLSPLSVDSDEWAKATRGVKSPGSPERAGEPESHLAEATSLVKAFAQSDPPKEADPQDGSQAPAVEDAPAEAAPMGAAAGPPLMPGAHGGKSS